MNRMASGFVLAFVVIALVGRSVSAQEKPEKIAIKFKLFDTNKPGSETSIDARNIALLSVRNPATKQPAFPQNVEVVLLPDKFYQIEVDKNLLVEHLVIETVSTRFSPADITKVVTKQPMTLYPGVSDSADEFSFSAYSAQMNNYKAIITDLNTALPDRRDAIRTLLGGKFKDQLSNLAAATKDRKRLLTNDPEEIAVAARLADEVLILYGLKADPVPQPLIVDCYPPVYELYYCDPARRQRLFGRFRR
jgi:hypothetical protein